MNVGKKISVGGTKYYVRSIIKENGTHSDVYEIIDENGKKFLLKKFKDRKKALAWLPYRSKNSHFGRTRDAHPKVFSEVRLVCRENEFLVKQVASETYWFEKEGKWTWCWLLVQEFVEGRSIGTYIENRTIDEFEKLQKVFKLLGSALKEWHSNDFAHGDPHLYNAMIEFVKNEPLKVTLIDYSQLHHPSFEYCQKCKCFEPKNRRFQEDIENNGVMGRGFLAEISNYEKKFGLDNSVFQESFWVGYGKRI